MSISKRQLHCIHTTEYCLPADLAMVMSMRNSLASPHHMVHFVLDNQRLTLDHSLVESRPGLRFVPAGCWITVDTNELMAIVALPVHPSSRSSRLSGPLRRCLWLV